MAKAKETPADGKVAIGERVECFAAELSAVKAALVARLPAGATVSTVHKGGRAVLTVVGG